MKRLFVAISAIFTTIALLPAAIALVFKQFRGRNNLDPTADELSLTAAMGAVEYRSEAPAFRGGSLFTMMGGSEVDLRDATLGPEGAELSVRTIMGGAELTIPSGWRVAIHERTIMGNIENLTDPPKDGEGPLLTINVLTVMGGVEIMQEPSWDTGSDSWPLGPA